jgi:hypothetical protein
MDTKADKVDAPEAEAVETAAAAESSDAVDTAESVETPAAEEPEQAAAPEPSAPDTPAGTAYMDHDDADASASYFGAEIVRGPEGLFLVPVHAIEHLVAHGFKLIRGAE